MSQFQFFTVSAAPRVGRKLCYWGLPKAHKEGSSRAQFVRWQLMQLDMGHDLTHVPLPHATDPSQRLRLATAAEAQEVFS